jgi:hypothetical protein
MNQRSAIAAIERAGALLVFPMDNRPEPASLWSHFFPRDEMRWEWDEDGDNRVSDLWHLRSALSTTRKVVYTKWYRGRATYLSRPLFVGLLRTLNPEGQRPRGLSPEAERVLEVLEGESPLSTKDLKRTCGLKGRENERGYEAALRQLWSRLLIVAFGEVDDGAFPSLAVGAARVLFEDLWAEAFALGLAEAQRRVERALRQSRGEPFLAHWSKLRQERARACPAGPRKRGRSKEPAPVRPVVRFEDLI